MMTEDFQYNREIEDLRAELDSAVGMRAATALEACRDEIERLKRLVQLGVDVYKAEKRVWYKQQRGFKSRIEELEAANAMPAEAPA